MADIYPPTVWAIEIGTVNPRWLQKGLEGMVAGVGTVLGADLVENELSLPIDYILAAVGGFVLGALSELILPSEPQSLAVVLLAGIAAGFVFQLVVDAITPPQKDNTKLIAGPEAQPAG